MDTYITNINGSWYAYAGDPIRHQVYSIGPDSPPDGQWFAGWTESGIKYVSCACKTRSGAYKKAKKYGMYCGEAWNV